MHKKRETLKERFKQRKDRLLSVCFVKVFLFTHHLVIKILINITSDNCEEKRQLLSIFSDNMTFNDVFGYESYYIWVPTLIVIVLILKYYQNRKNTSSTHDVINNETESLMGNDNIINASNGNGINIAKDQTILNGFKKFQNNYVLIFLLVMLADWMQGPYVFKLYKEYNYSDKDIAILFVIGFGTSGITGAFIGSITDRFGRKLSCLSFCIFYSLCCLTKHYHNLNMLLIGRFLGGISTSLLFSSFESWMVTTHHEKKFPNAKLGETFGLAWGYNSVIAVIAGIITSFAVNAYKKYNIVGGTENNSTPYEVAAFDCSAVVLIISFIIIIYSWNENYGDTKVGSTYQSIKNALNVFYNDTKVLYVGTLQSFFESAMYLFVFMWTMALDSINNNDIDLGIIFAVFMEACFVGNKIQSILLTQYNLSVEVVSIILTFIAGISLLIVKYTQNYELRLFLFILFELCVGIYFPVIGQIREKYVPDNARATIMNIFRIPLNLIVVIVLWYIDYFGENVFLIAAFLLFIASFIANKLSKSRKQSISN